MKIQEPFKVEFHSDAATRFSQLAQEVLKCVHSFERVDTPPTRGAEIHPVASLTADDIIGEVMVQESSFNGLGEETGRYWNSKGLRVGWEGREFEAIKDLVLRFGNAAPIKNRVSSRFLLDEIFKWLRETLEAKRSDALPDYIAERCSSEIRDYEIWSTEPTQRLISRLVMSGFEPSRRCSWMSGTRTSPKMCRTVQK